jgi:protein-disulfide isomerase
MGSPTAKVTLIEYGALTCPHCAAFNENVFPLLKEKYIDTGKVRYVFRLFPLHGSDAWGEKIARCLPEDNYFQFVDLLFRNQAKWGPEQHIDAAQGTVDMNAVHEGLIQMARVAGMGAEKVDQCINDKTDDQRINKVAEDGAARYNITGTPTLIVNGVSQGANVPSWENLQKVIDEALAK